MEILLLYQDDSRLWQVILDHQYGSIGCDGIAAIEPDEIREEIVIVVELKAQAELGDALPVDVLISRRLEIGHIPPGGRWIVREGPGTPLARQSLEVGGLQSRVVAKGALADIDDDLAMCGKRVRAGYALLSHLEHYFGDDGIIGQRGGVERQNGAVLLVLGVIAQEESSTQWIGGPALVAGFARL